MKNRAEALGGTLQITSANGQTCVVGRFPFQGINEVNV